MGQRKMKQRKSKQSKSLAKILTLGIATATVVSSLSVPGGLLAPETVYADDNTGTAESGDQGTEPQEEPIQFDVITGPNDSATVYVMQVTSLADTDKMSYQYSINGTDYYSLQKLQTQETFGASQTVDLHVRAVRSDGTILAAGNRKITTPSASDVPTISGTDKFSDRTEVTITATPGAIIYYTTDGTVPTNGSQQYNTPITLTETTTIQAIAIEDGHIMSDVVGMAFMKESSGGSSSDGALPLEAAPAVARTVEAVPAAARTVETVPAVTRTVETVPAVTRTVEAARTVAAAPAAVHQAVPPTADLKLLRHRTITRTRLRLRPKPEKMVQL